MKGPLLLRAIIPFVIITESIKVVKRGFSTKYTAVIAVVPMAKQSLSQYIVGRHSIGANQILENEYLCYSFCFLLDIMMNKTYTNYFVLRNSIFNKEDKILALRVPSQMVGKSQNITLSISSFCACLIPGNIINRKQKNQVTQKQKAVASVPINIKNRKP